MTPDLTERLVSVADSPVRILEGGAEGAVLGEAVLLLHGGAPGTSPLCASSDVWGTFASAIADTHRVVAIDLPGSGGTVPRSVEDLTPAGAITCIAETSRKLGLSSVHLVAHDESALMALAMASEPPAGLSVRSCSLIAPTSVAPSGDAMIDISLLHPPQPHWTRHSHLWCLRRLSATEQHITADLLDALDRSAAGEAHQRAAELLDSVPNTTIVDRAVARSQELFFARARDDGFAIPIGIVWGAADPLSSLPRAQMLYELVSGGSSPAELHIVNRCGHFPFRESENATAAIVTAVLARANSALITQEEVSHEYA